MKRLALILALGTLALSAFAKVELPAVIGSNMVLQQNTDAALWGKATPGSTVVIRASWTKTAQKVTADSDGRWETRIATPAAGGPFEITFSEGRDKVTIENILTGEVWFCSGQSNMSMPVRGFMGQDVIGGSEAIMSASPKTPIRIFNEPTVYSITPREDCDCSWQLNEPDAVANVSAIAWFFAESLNKVLDVPVGIIACSWGGTPIEAWMSEALLRKDFAAEVNLDHLALADNSAMEAYAAQVKKSTKDLPAVLYNGMMKPLMPFTFKGIIWYQGESNRLAADLYAREQPEFVEMLREDFQNPDAGFYYMQIAPFHYRGFDSRSAPVFQQMQLENQDMIPHSGMACIADIGDPYVIHPRDKKTAAQRLSWLALANDYGVKGIDPNTPRLRKVEYKDGKAYLTFDAPRGLVPYRVNVEGFELAGADKEFHAAEAYVRYDIPEYNQICVSCAEVPDPIAVRYCFHDWTKSTVFTPYGIPLSPFRTDDWDTIRYNW